MAGSNGAPSWLAIVLVIVLIGVVIYFFSGGEPDDNELEVDIGMAVPLLVGTAAG
ncbi:MAG TPA: hypothetical protein VFQ22_06580 [Longimicrobiales bacterium]|nr:hypothetical protein [Longimicrobiales bacterium]